MSTEQPNDDQSNSEPRAASPPPRLSFRAYEIPEMIGYGKGVTAGLLKTGVIYSFKVPGRRGRNVPLWALQQFLRDPTVTAPMQPGPAATGPTSGAPARRGKGGSGGAPPAAIPPR